MTTEKELLDMEIHEEVAIDRFRDILRVPGGWLYTNSCETGTGGYDMTSCFVPERQNPHPFIKE